MTLNDNMDIQEKENEERRTRRTTKVFRQPDDSKCCAKRWLLAVMGLWLGIENYMLNSNMSIALVCMVKDTSVHADGFITEAVVLDNAINISLNLQYNLSMNIATTAPANASIKHEFKEANDLCQDSEKTPLSRSQKTEFTWSKKTQSFILSSYFYGYITTQIPSGWLAAKYNGKLVVGACMTLASLLTLLLPTFARAHVLTLILARAFLGVCMGMVLPSFCGLVGTWALPTERSRFMSLCWFGHMTGAVLGYLSSGLLCVYGFASGWDSIFYVHGTTGILFVLTWWYTVHNSPHTHPRISEAEKELLMKHVRVQKTPDNQKDRIPWRNIFTHVPVYVVYLSHICDNWTFYLLLTCLPQFMKDVLKFDAQRTFYHLLNCLPQFMKDVLKFDAQRNGIFSCLPFLTLMCGIGFAGICADFIHSKKCLSITSTRKLFQISGLTGVAIFILIPGYLTCEHRTFAIACLCLCTFFEGIGLTGGYSSNAIDIAPRYASIIFAISNTVATVPGMVAPVAVAAITKNGTSEEWKMVFYIAAGFSLFTALVYGVFASSELASWATSSTNIDISCSLSKDSEKFTEHEDKKYDKMHL